jgi:steroid delta-isomerase-like uncharacterized protein
MHDCFATVSPRAIDRYTEDARLRAMYASIVVAFPDAEFDGQWCVVEGDRAVVGGVVTGTHLGTWRGVPATGRAIRTLGTLMFQLRDGRLVDLMVVYDSLAIAEQLELLEPLDPKVCEVPASAVEGRPASGRTPCGDALLGAVSAARR